MISETKLQANKLNAQKSTGPRSEEGKAAVSLNSITRGLRARHAVMLIEDPNEFRALCQTLYDEWQPMSPTEAHLIEQMAVNQEKMGAGDEGSPPVDRISPTCSTSTMA